MPPPMELWPGSVTPVDGELSKINFRTHGTLFLHVDASGEDGEIACVITLGLAFDDDS